MFLNKYYFNTFFIICFSTLTVSGEKKASNDILAKNKRFNSRFLQGKIINNYSNNFWIRSKFALKICNSG